MELVTTEASVAAKIVLNWIANEFSDSGVEFSFKVFPDRELLFVFEMKRSDRIQFSHSCSVRELTLTCVGDLCRRISNGWNAIISTCTWDRDGVPHFKKETTCCFRDGDGVPYSEDDVKKNGEKIWQYAEARDRRLVMSLLLLSAVPLVAIAIWIWSLL